MDIASIDFAEIFKISGHSDGQKFRVRYVGEKLDGLLKHDTCGNILSDFVIAEEFKIDIRYAEILSTIFKIRVAELITDDRSMEFLIEIGHELKNDEWRG